MERIPLLHTIIQMEWDQVLFKKVLGYYERWKVKNSKEDFSQTVQLADISSRLTLIARALTGRNIDILPAEKEGGWKNIAFYLPASFSLLPSLEENLEFYIFRVVYLSIQCEEKLNWEDTKVIPNLEESRQKGIEIAPIILQKMEAEYPSSVRFFNRIKTHFGATQNEDYWLYGKYMVNRDVFENGQGEALDKNALEKNKENPTTEIKSKPVEEVEILQVDKKAQEDFMLTHNFEKVETADEFSGVWRGFDGDDNLEEDADALNDLNLKHLVRTDEVADSIYQADFRDLIKIAESADIEEEEVCLTYKEWDFTKKKIQTGFLQSVFKKNQGR